MFVCEKHGDLKSEWCDMCRKPISCDCMDIETDVFKEVFDFATGKKTVIFILEYCGTCGRIIGGEPVF